MRVSNRPSIPDEIIIRKVYSECGHRCAVCGEPIPLELAHIIPWHESKEPKAEDLICLCANCHGRADREKWEEKEMREHKQTPWVIRKYGKADGMPKSMAKVDVTINMDINHFNEKEQRWLRYAIAAFLDISPNAVQITSIEKDNSVKVTIKLPRQSAKELLSAYKKKSSGLFRNLAPLTLLDIRREMFIEKQFKNNVGQEKSFLWDSYNSIKEFTLEKLEDVNNYYTYIHNKNGEHCECIIEKLSEILEPFYEKLNFTSEELYVLLCSIHLHDIAKTLPEFRGVDFDYTKGLDPNNPSDMKNVEKIEDFHAYDIFRMVWCLATEEYDRLTTNNEKFLDMWEVTNKKIFESLRERNDRQETEFLIKAIAYICGMHKSLNYKDKNEVYSHLEKFVDGEKDSYLEYMSGEREERGQNIGIRKGALSEMLATAEQKGFRIDFLAALLKLGDCLDMTVRRINKQIFEKAVVSEKTNKKVLFKWYQFYFTDEIEVPPVSEKGIAERDIIVKYVIPSEMKTNFPLFRSEAEKSFEDKTFLKEVEYYLNNPEEKESIFLKRQIIKNYITDKYVKKTKGYSESITLNIYYELEEDPEKEGYKDNIKELTKEPKPKPKFALNKYYPISKEFEESKRWLPYSLSTLYILTLFYRLSDERLTAEQISWKTGVNKDDVIQCCLRLSEEYYLEDIPNSDPKEFKKAWNSNDKKDIADQVEKLMEDYYENPYTMKSRADEMEQFGKPLPLSSLPVDSFIQTGISGLDEILYTGGKSKTGGGLGIDKCVLITGTPGTGKTTFGMQFLCRNIKTPGLYIAFEEDIQQLREDFEKFEWEVDKINIKNLYMAMRDEHRKIFSKIANLIDENKPDLMVIDSITRLEDYIPEDKRREIFADFITILKIRHITALFIGEETGKEEITFIKYLVDGIIQLISDGSRRYFQILKMRGQNPIIGRHSYEILDVSSIEKSPLCKFGHKPGINVFPDITTYIGKEPDESIKRSKKPESILSGTDKLDDLLPINEDKKTFGFAPGNSIVVAGPPGSGKTLIGLQFLKKGREEEKRGLWISLEGDRDKLEKSVENFDKDVGLKDLINNSEYFNFEYFPPASINIEKFMYIIVQYIEKEHVERVVIDSTTDLKPVFNDELEFKNFIDTLIQTLNIYDVTTMLIYRTLEFFGGQETSKIEIASIVDTVIMLRNLERGNKIERGIYVLKTRGREHKSLLHSVVISKDKGLEVKQLGWAEEGWLSGEVGSVHIPEVFLKLFYENPAETNMNKRAINEFKNERYPTGHHQFTMVRKPYIDIDFWSFTEKRGPAHSNVKVVSVGKTWAVALLERNRLHPLEDFIPKETKERRKNDFFWKGCVGATKAVRGEGKKDADIISLIPYYADIGVLACRDDILRLLAPANSPEKDSDIHTKIERFNAEDIITWDNLIELGNELIFCKPLKERVEKQEDKKIAPYKYPFAMPYLYDISSFMPFFMEVLWSHGGNIFKIPDEFKLKDGSIIKKKEATSTQLKTFVLNNVGNGNGKEILAINEDVAAEALSSLVTWIISENVPNPYAGDFSSEAIFSRQWYSRIRNTICKEVFLHEETEKEREKPCIKREDVGVKFLPTNVKITYSAYELCCLGVIGEALSPETGWLFIDDLSSDEKMKEIAKERVGLPARQELYYNEEVKNYDEKANEIAMKLFQKFKEPKESSEEKTYEYKNISRIPFYLDIEGLIYNEIKEVFEPTKIEELRGMPKEEIKKECKEYLKNAHDKILKYIKEQSSEQKSKSL